MIIGRGAIASILIDRPGAIFFASGVSNSRCDDVFEFIREKNLLSAHWNEHMTECLFYFSSISVNFSETPYTKHKLQMESYVREWFDNHWIIRIGNLTGDKNPNTFINYIRNRQEKGLDVEVRDEWKYMIEPETLVTLTSCLPLTGKHELTVTSHIKTVPQCLLDY